MCVYKAGDKDASLLYLDGVSVGSESGSFPATSAMDFATDDKLVIGNFWSFATYSFDGLMGQTAIWNSALTSSQVSGIYALGRRDTDLTASYGTNLVAYYTMNRNASSSPDTSSTIYDRSTNSNNGTMTNSPTLVGANDGTPAGSPESIIVREGLNSNKDGLGFPFRNPERDVLRVSDGSHVNMGNTLTSSSLPATNLLENSFTMSAWIKPDDGHPATASTIIGSVTSSSWTGYLYWRLDTDGKIRFVYGTNSGQEHSLISSVIYADKESTWKHITTTFEMQDGVGTGGATITTYDGATLAGGGTHIGTDSTPQDDGGSNIWNKDNYVNVVDMGIGTRIMDTTNEQPFNGLIDEVMMYNKVLSTAEIIKNYKHGKGKHKN